MEPNIHAGYNTGGSFTAVDPRAASPIRPLTARDQLTALMKEEQGYRRRAPAPAPTRVAARPQPAVRGSAGMVTGGDGSGGTRMAVDPLAAQKAQDRYDQSLRIAARKPLHVGMSQGWTSDPDLLPNRLRPDQSSFTGPMSAPVSAGDSSRASQAEDQKLEAGKLDLARQRNLLQAMADRDFEQGGVGRSY